MNTDGAKPIEQRMANNKFPMSIRVPVFVLGALLCLFCSSIGAQQQPAKISRVGFVVAGFPSTITARMEAFRQGLRELGYLEEKNIVIECVLPLQSPILNLTRKQTAELAMKARLPSMYYAPEFSDAGGLISYATSINDLYRRAAIYMDRLLKGAKPGDLPVEQPTRFELVINLKTAKQIGVTIPPNVLARADRVIR
jgi:hypothetical protein